MAQKKKTIRDIVPGIPETKSPFLPEQKPPVQRNVQPDQPNVQHNVQESDKPKVFRDEKTGRISGVELPDGRTFLGLDPDTVRSIIEKETSERATPQGAVEFGDREMQIQKGVEKSKLQQEIAERIRGKPTAEQSELAGQVGQGVPVELEQLSGRAKEDIIAEKIREQAVKQAAVGAAGVGGVAGVLTGGAALGPGALLGAAGGLLTGTVTGFFQGLQQIKADAANNPFAQYTARKTTIPKTINAVNKGQINPADGVNEYNEDLSTIKEAYNQLIFQTKNNPSERSKNQDKLFKMAEYIDYADSVLTPMMRNAVLQPSNVDLLETELEAQE